MLHYYIWARDGCDGLRVGPTVQHSAGNYRSGDSSLMVILGQFLVRAASRLARDPRVRAKAAEVLERDIKPMAEEAWRKTKPKLEAARDEVRSIAKETDPRRNPGAFAAKVKKRIIDRKPPRG